MSKVFIFSTRYSFIHYPNDNDYKKKDKYLFSTVNCVEEELCFDVSILFKSEEKTLNWFWNLDVNGKNKYKDDFIKELGQDNNEAGKLFWEDAIIHKNIKLSDEQKQILIKIVESDYIEEKNIQPYYYCKIKDKEIYAVNPYDGGRKTWIECLLNLNDSVKSAIQIFLLLHDRDLYDYSESFKVLDQTEVDKPNVNILAYYHEKNPVTEILLHSDLKDIEDRIESVFYKYLLKKALLAYIDAAFYSNKDIDVAKTAVQNQYMKNKLIYEKIQDLPDFSEETILNLNPLKEEDIDKFNKWLRLLSNEQDNRRKN